VQVVPHEEERQLHVQGLQKDPPGYAASRMFRTGVPSVSIAMPLTPFFFFFFVNVVRICAARFGVHESRCSVKLRSRESHRMLCGY
jgi:hypothetical protein